MHPALLISDLFPLLCSHLSLLWINLRLPTKEASALSSLHFYLFTLCPEAGLAWGCELLANDWTRYWFVHYSEFPIALEMIMLHCFRRIRWYDIFYEIYSTELGCNNSLNTLLVFCHHEGCCLSLYFLDSLQDRRSTLFCFLVAGFLGCF